MWSYFLEHNRFLGFFGIAVIIGLAWLLSFKRSAISWKLVMNGLLLHLGIGWIVLRTSVGKAAVTYVAALVTQLYYFADVGSNFVFGSLIDQNGPWGFIFACKVLPVIIFFGAFMGLLFYFGIVQKIVSFMNFCIQPLLGTSGAETLCAVSNSFLGQTEAPLLIRPYLKDMTRSELFVVMVSGMATISGAILVVFAAMGVPATHLLASSVMSIPASLIIAKMLLPETEKSKTAAGASIALESNASNMFDAIAGGTSDGLTLALNVGAMLISFLALLALLNAGLGYVGVLINSALVLVGLPALLPALSMNLLFSYLFAPFGYLMGFTGDELFKVGQLLGTKVAVNELIAYSMMGTMELSERAVTIMTYALCGFSNFSCIGIQIGGIGALVPEKRPWLTQLGLYAVLGGTLSNLLSAMVATILL
jgi:CNT family concentrative nucleoside transporter